RRASLLDTRFFRHEIKIFARSFYLAVVCIQRTASVNSWNEPATITPARRALPLGDREAGRGLRSGAGEGHAPPSLPRDHGGRLLPWGRALRSRPAQPQRRSDPS